MILVRVLYKTVRWVEDTLIKHPAFALPGRKELINNNYDTILIDATETPIERPKKSRMLYKRVLNPSYCFIYSTLTNIITLTYMKISSIFSYIF